MRGARWLLLLAIVAILGWLRLTYLTQRSALERQAPPKPAPLPVDVTATRPDWYVRKTDDKGRTLVEIWAKNFKQDKNSSRIDLEQVRLHVFHKDGDQFDLVESPAATYQPSEDKLFAEGEVSITLKVPTDGPPSHRLVSIHTSAATFENKTGKASTDRPADFTFENGTGKCVGAVYDPNTKELQMQSNVELNLQARGPNGKPMKLESGQLLYRELDSTILLSPWVRLKRDTSTLEGGDTVVNLNKNGAIELVQTKNAKGNEQDPKRLLEYAADQLTVHYSDQGDVDHAFGESNARVASSSEMARTTTTADRIDLEFDSQNHESTLKRALATGHAVVESKPLAAAPGQLLPDTRLLKSEIIEVKMNPGGREVDQLLAHAPGHIEFLPNQPGSRHRQMDGEQIALTYGPRNMIQSFRSVNVATRTDPVKKSDAPQQTWSKNMLAEFDPKTGQMARIRQWDNFRYVEGERKAVASQAILDQATNVITLETAARFWDPTGSTSADKIHLDQVSGSFSADGHVSSSRIQNKKTASSGLLSGGDPVQATAQRMTSTKDNSLISYEGKADLWQGASRVRADRIEIDQEAKRMVANGGVQTQLLEKEKTATPAKPAAPSIFTTVKSAAMVYTDGDRLAYYTGGVVLVRPDLLVKSIELRSYLSEAGADNSLDRTYADGKVEIHQSSPGRTRDGAAEHAEYYTTDQKIILRGGNPTLNDSLKGATAAQELTYFAGDDRLLVNGAPEQPAKSRLRRK
jgi:lipopolysaccharide export system protein LptA